MLFLQTAGAPGGSRRRCSVPNTAGPEGGIFFSVSKWASASNNVIHVNRQPFVGVKKRSNLPALTVSYSWAGTIRRRRWWGGSVSSICFVKVCWVNQAVRKEKSSQGACFWAWSRGILILPRFTRASKVCGTPLFQLPPRSSRTPDEVFPFIVDVHSKSSGPRVFPRTGYLLPKSYCCTHSQPPRIPLRDAHTYDIGQVLSLVGILSRPRERCDTGGGGGGDNDGK